MLRLRIDRDFRTNGYAVYLINDDLKNRVTHIAKPVSLTFEPIEEGCRFPDEPTLTIDREFAQQLVMAFRDGSIEAGLFSSSDIHPELKAKDANLEDLRMVVKSLFNLNQHRDR